MKERIKKILRVLKIYHPLQSFYRGTIYKIKNYYYRNRYAKFKGEGFTCNVCKSSYKIFIPDYPKPEDRVAIEKNKVIAGYGENIICPNCMSTARERLVLAFLDTYSLQNKKVLHLSPEKHVYNYLKRNTFITAADLHPDFYKPIGTGILKADATSLQFENDYFDIVIANHIMEHIDDDQTALSEIFRVLKPGGRAVLQVPYSQINFATIETPGINNLVLQSKLYGQKDHVRIYSLLDYVSRLKLSGFVVVTKNYSQLDHLYKYAIQKNESFLEITKPIA